MVRGKLFAVQNGWVWVVPQKIEPDMIERFSEYWATFSPDKPLLIIPSTDLLVNEDGRLLVREFAIAFPEPEVESVEA
jgi:hypothetical protein